MNLAGIKIRVDDSSNSLFFKDFTLSDINVIKLLIQYRYKYDSYLYSEKNFFFGEAGEIQSMNEEIILTYISLDQTIVECNFSPEQLKLIGLYEHGFTIKEMANELGLGSDKYIRKKFNTICNQILKQNLWNWRKTHYTHTLKLKSKKCSKCKELLPAMDEFFAYDSFSNSYKSNCKRCRN